MFQRAETNLANSTFAAVSPPQGRLADPLEPRPLAIRPAIPALSIHLYRFGAKDVVAIGWHDVRIETALLNGQPMVPIAWQLPPAPGPRRMWQASRIEGQAHLSLSGTSTDGRATLGQVVIDPTFTTDTRGLAALTLEETPVPGGLRLVPRLSVLAPSDSGTVQPDLASLTTLTIGRRRNGHPVLRRPLTALMPDVTGLIQMVSEALCAAEKDWASKACDDEPAPDWIRRHLLQHSPQTDVLDPDPLDKMIQIIQEVRRTAGDRLKRIHRTQGPTAAQRAEAVWANALAGLVAEQLPPDVVTMPAVLPCGAQTTLSEIFLAEGDRLEVAGIPPCMRLEVHPDRDVPRDMGLTLPEVRDGALRWPPMLCDQDAADMTLLQRWFAGRSREVAP